MTGLIGLTGFTAGMLEESLHIGYYPGQKISRSKNPVNPINPVILSEKSAK